MNILVSNVLRSLAIAAASCAQADITAPIVTNATVDIIPLGNDRYDVEIMQGYNCCALVLLDSNGSNDVIRKITIFNNPIGPDGLPDGVNDLVTLTIRKHQTEVARSSIHAIEEIHVDSPTNTRLDLRHIAIDGSLGSQSSLRSIEASTMELLSVGGSV